eukprot:TRINITY_DN34819_c0_g1_i2.p1 TRINITY_DN34819_c0_g1~~TRINITY_DN34819_c0_g1_i2.p1  ORF type:complete len:491 (+),score=73.44 TRINITY_DN34819_c0_g1_i2:173-1474(+)
MATSEPQSVDLLALSSEIVAVAWEDCSVLKLCWCKNASAGGFISHGHLGKVGRSSAGTLGRAPGRSLRSETLAVGHDDGSVSLWDSVHDDFIGNLHGHSKMPATNRLRDHFLLSAADDGFVRLWDVEHQRCIESAFSLDRMASGHSPVLRCFVGALARTILVNSKTGFDILSCGENRRGRLSAQGIHTDQVTALCVDHGGPMFATNGRHLRIWDLRMLAAPIAEVRGADTLTFLGASGERVLAASDAGGLRLLDGQTLRCLWEDSSAAVSMLDSPCAYQLPSRDPRDRISESLVYGVRENNLFVWSLKGKGDDRSLVLQKSVQVRQKQPAKVAPDGSSPSRASCYCWGPDGDVERRRSTHAAAITSAAAGFGQALPNISRLPSTFQKMKAMVARGTPQGQTDFYAGFYGLDCLGFGELPQFKKVLLKMQKGIS